MNLNTDNPETLLVLCDGQLDEEYYDQVYEQKRREALEAVRNKLIKDLLGVPAKLGQGVLAAAAHIVEAAN